MVEYPLKIDDYALIRDHVMRLVDGHVKSLKVFKAHADYHQNQYIRGQAEYHRHAISALTHAIKTAKQRIPKGSYDK